MTAHEHDQLARKVEAQRKVLISVIAALRALAMAAIGRYDDRRYNRFLDVMDKLDKVLEDNR
jgi:hypothetical protein